MKIVIVKARFQTGTGFISSNQILEISDSDIARGVFYVLFNSIFYVFSTDPNEGCIDRFN